MATRIDDVRRARIAAALAAAVGVIGLIGWLTGVSFLHTPAPHGGELKIDSALSLVLLAGGVLAPWRAVRLAAQGGAAALAALSLVAWLGAPGLHPGDAARMPLATAVCVALMVSSGFARRPAVRQSAVLGAGVIAGLVLVGFSYGTQSLTKFSQSSMSVPGAVGVVLLAVAVLLLTEDGWLHWVLRGSDAGAVALRRTLPPVILGLPVLTFVHMYGERILWEDERVAEAGFVVVLIVLVSALLFRVASSLRLLDLQREQARRDLVELNARLATDVRTSFATLRSARQRIGSLEKTQREVLTVHDDMLQALFASGLMLRTTLDSLDPVAPDAPVHRTLDCMDEAMQAIRRVVEDLNDQLGGPKT